MHNCQFSKHKSISIINNNVLLHYLTAYAFSRMLLSFVLSKKNVLYISDASGGLVVTFLYNRLAWPRLLTVM